MAKYHINKDTGEVGICKAEIKDCPNKGVHDGIESHYNNAAEALAQGAKMMENRYESQSLESKTRNVAKSVFAWSDLEDYELGQISRQDTAVRDYYVEMREETPNLTHDQIFDVLTSWDDWMMSPDLTDEEAETFWNTKDTGKYSLYDLAAKTVNEKKGTKYPLSSEV